MSKKYRVDTEKGSFIVETDEQSDDEIRAAQAAKYPTAAEQGAPAGSVTLPQDERPVPYKVGPFQGSVNLPLALRGLTGAAAQATSVLPGGSTPRPQTSPVKSPEEQFGADVATTMTGTKAIGGLVGGVAKAAKAKLMRSVGSDAVAEAAVDAPHPQLPQTEKMLTATKIRLEQQEAQLQNMLEENLKSGHKGYEVSPAIKNVLDQAKMNARLNSVQGDSVAQALEDFKNTHLQTIRSNYGGTALDAKQALEARRAFDADPVGKGLPDFARQGVRNTYNDAMYAGVDNPSKVKEVMQDYSRLLDTKAGLQEAVQRMRTSPAIGYAGQFERVNPRISQGIGMVPYGKKVLGNP